MCSILPRLTIYVHFLQGWFSGTGAIVLVSVSKYVTCQITLEHTSEIDPHQATTKCNKSQITMECFILGLRIYVHDWILHDWSHSLYFYMLCLPPAHTFISLLPLYIPSFRNSFLQQMTKAILLLHDHIKYKKMFIIHLTHLCLLCGQLNKNKAFNCCGIIWNPATYLCPKTNK